MIVRSEQFTALQSQAEAGFEKRVIRHILENHRYLAVRFPDRTIRVAEAPEKLLCEIIRNGIVRARSYGMKHESSLAAFVSLMFAVAPNFDDHPLIRGVLRNETEPPDSRIELFGEEVTDENWEEAEQGYDPLAWNVTPASESSL